MPFFPDATLKRQVAHSQAITNIPNWWKQTGISPLMTSGAWSSANMAIYTPVILPKAASIREVALLNGAAVAGNFYLGIYLPDADGKPGARIWTSTAQAQAGTNYYQSVQIASPRLWLSGLVYFACVMNGTTGTCIRLAALTTDGSGVFEGGIFTEAAAYPLPANATPSATPVVANVPILMATPASVY